MAVIDAECRNAGIGPYLPADASPRDSRRARTECDILSLKPWWDVLDDAGKFAQSLQLPPPYDKPRDVYSPELKPHQYFDALCTVGAGEVIFRKVDHVEGIVELRARTQESDVLSRHLSAFEDPATFAQSQFLASQTLTRRGLYKFVETNKAGLLLRIVQSDSQEREGRAQVKIDSFSARYGFIWRGIREPRHLENGISGGEFLVVDLKNNEILGFKRDYKFRWIGPYSSEQPFSRTGIVGGESCPAEIVRNRVSNFRDFRDFLLTVLIPPPNSVR